MKQDVEGETAIRQYLLGELSPNEQKQLEERLLVDNDYFQQLLLVEEDLIDDYVSGKLPPDERTRFDSYFLAAPEHQQDLRFAQALRKYVSSSAVEPAPAVVTDSPRRVSWWRSLLGFLRPQRPLLAFSLAALILLVVGGLWLIKRQAQRQSEPGLARTEPTAQPTASPTNVNQQPTNNAQPEIERQANSGQGLPDATNKQQTPELASQPESRKPSVYSLALVSGVSRGDGETKRVKIPRGTQRVRLQLELDSGADDYQSYQAVLETSTGRQILNKSGLRARATASGKAVIWEIPANLFKPEDYYLKLSGQTADGQLESAGAYSLRVLQQ